MKLKLTGILSVLMTLISFGAYAAETSADDAKLVARGWRHINRRAFGDVGEVTGVKAEKNEKGEVLWYVVTTEKGTMIVSPDDEIEPIIAVIPDTTGGEIPEGHPLRAMLLADLPNRLAAAKTGSTNSRLKLAGAKSVSKSAAKWAKLKSEAATPSSRLKMLGADGNPSTIVSWLDGWNSSYSIMDEEDPSVVKTQTLRFWNQSSSTSYFSNEQIFNLYTPSNYVCGCVATAGAATMHYFRPASGRSGYTGKCTVDGEPVDLVTKGGDYDWSLIDSVELRRQYKYTTLSDDQVDLLGRVAYDCGVAVDMAYASNGSGAYTEDLARAFKNVFGMANAQPVSTSSIKEEFYPKFIYHQIRAGAPVVMGIQGHAVVACGYGTDGDDTDYTYVFMGWGGSYDAWYQLPEIVTKSTAGGSSYTSSIVRRLVTSISPDDNFIPLVGRVVDLDGEPVPNYDGLTNDVDGVGITVDENGFWGIRLASCEGGTLVDAAGNEHPYTVGAAARQTNLQSLSADDLPLVANALPDEMVIEIDTAASGFLRVYNDPERALAAAWKTGKLLYVIGGTNEEAIAEWKIERREDVDGLYVDFKRDHVIVQLEPDYYPELVGEFDLREGAFDPRRFSYEGAWDETNGLWDEKEEWNPVDELDPTAPHKRRPTEIRVEGLDFISSLEANHGYSYTAIIRYNDGLEMTLRDEFANWSVEDSTLAKNVGSTLYPNQNVAGTTKFIAANVPFAETVVQGDLEIEIYPDPIVIFPDWNTVGGRKLEQAKSELSDRSSENAKTYALHLAEKNHYRVYGGAGTRVTICANAAYAVESGNGKVLADLICTGYELYEDGVLTKEGTFDAMSEDVDAAHAGKQVGFSHVIRTADTKVKWVWGDSEYQIQTDATNCVIDQEPQFVANGHTLTITATPPGGQKAEETMIVWEGARPGEVVDNLTVEVLADSPRTIVANGVDMSTGTGMFRSTNGDVSAFVAPRGYQVELVADKDNAGYYTYAVTPAPTKAEPEPIAFSMIQMNEDNSVVTLGITNAVEWCNYAVYGTNTLVGGFVIEGATPVTNFQWKSTAREIKLELPTNGNCFWRATAAEGLIEE